MDCTGLCKKFTIEDCNELQQDCLDWMRIVTDLCTCNRHLNPKNPFTINKILTKSNFSVNVNVVQLRDFSGSVYAHFPFGIFAFGGASDDLQVRARSDRSERARAQMC